MAKTLGLPDDRRTRAKVKKHKSSAEKRKPTDTDTAATIGDEDHVILFAREYIDRTIKAIGILGRDLAIKEEGSEEYKQLMAKIEKTSDALMSLCASVDVLLGRRPSTQVRKGGADETH